MKTLDALLMRYFGLAAAAGSLALLVAAHSFELFGGYLPCAMCMRQREAHWAAVGIGLVVALAGRRPARRIALWLLAGAYLVGTGLAGYHLAIEHHWVKIAACEGGAHGFWPDPQFGAAMEHVASLFGYHRASLAQDLNAMLNHQTRLIIAPACDKPNWWFLGLTMAGWNGLISLVLCLLSVRAALFKRVRA